MPSLLSTVTQLPWMERLRLADVTMWMGDGHFHNTLHNDPHDNALCQLHGRVPPQLPDPLAALSSMPRHAEKDVSLRL